MTDGLLKVNYDQDIMEEYDDSYETKFAEKTEKQNKNAIRKKSNGHGKLGIFTASHVRN